METSKARMPVTWLFYLKPWPLKFNFWLRLEDLPSLSDTRKQQYFLEWDSTWVGNAWFWTYVHIIASRVRENWLPAWLKSDQCQLPTPGHPNLLFGNPFTSPWSVLCMAFYLKGPVFNLLGHLMYCSKTDLSKTVEVKTTWYQHEADHHNKYTESDVCQSTLLVSLVLWYTWPKTKIKQNGQISLVRLI